MLIDGRKIAEEITDKLQKEVQKLKKKGVTPGLAIITLGNDKAWKTYVGQKIKLAQKLGINETLIKLENPTEAQLIKTIKKLNSDKRIHGIIAQRPFPKKINNQVIVDAVDPQKDIDGFKANSPYQVPVWLAVKKMLQTVSGLSDNGLFIEWLQDKTIVVVGKGVTAGKPAIEELERLSLHPIVIDSRTKNVHELLLGADIIIAAAGRKIIHKEDLKDGVVIVGVGVYRGEDGLLHGDYDEEEINDVAGAYTPTPGGVGPVNLAYLFKNLIEATKKQF